MNQSHCLRSTTKLTRDEEYRWMRKIDFTSQGLIAGPMLIRRFFLVLLGAVSFFSSLRSSLLTPWIFNVTRIFIYLPSSCNKNPIFVYNNIKLNTHCKYFHRFLFIWENKLRYCICSSLIANLIDIFKQIFLNFACNLREPPFNKLLILIGLVPCGDVCTSISFIKNKGHIIKWN